MASSSTDSGFVDNWQEEKTLQECNLYMFTSQDSCDVTFRVGENEEIVRAHRYVLISRSCVFHAMLCGPISEPGDIKIPDVSKEMFTEFLKFLYTDKNCLTPENVTGLMYLSKKYAVRCLERCCLSFLETSLSPDNACVILEQAHVFDERNLYESALNLVIKHGNISLKAPGCKDLCHGCFDKILSSNDLDAKHELVFLTALDWSEAECRRQEEEVCSRNQRLVLGDTVYQIGFTSFNAADFVKKVIPSKILDDSEGLKIMSHIACPETDVSPFNTCQPQLMTYEREIYHHKTGTPLTDRTVFKVDYVFDEISIITDRDLYLHGLVLQFGKGATYTISIAYSKPFPQSLLKTTFTTTLFGSRFLFEGSIFLKKNTAYDISVKHVKGDPPDSLGIRLKENDRFDGYSVTLKRNKVSVARGLLKSLIFGTSPRKKD